MGENRAIKRFYGIGYAIRKRKPVNLTLFLIGSIAIGGIFFGLAASILNAYFYISFAALGFAIFSYGGKDNIKRGIGIFLLITVIGGWIVFLILPLSMGTFSQAYAWIQQFMSTDTLLQPWNVLSDPFFAFYIGLFVLSIIAFTASTTLHKWIMLGLSAVVGMISTITLWGSLLNFALEGVFGFDLITWITTGYGHYYTITIFWYIPILTSIFFIAWIWQFALSRA